VVAELLAGHERYGLHDAHAVAGVAVCALGEREGVEIECMHLGLLGLVRS
jgi:hypothetical protein